MKLTLSERVILMDLLPKASDYAGMKEARRGREVLSFTPEEIQEYGITFEGGMMRFNEAGLGYAADLPLSEWITEQIRDALRKLSDKRDLKEHQVSLYEKFIVAFDQV